METEIREFVIFNCKKILWGMVPSIRIGRKTLKLKTGNDQIKEENKIFSDEMAFKWHQGRLHCSFDVFHKA